MDSDGGGPGDFDNLHRGYHTSLAAGGVYIILMVEPTEDMSR